MNNNILIVDDEQMIRELLYSAFNNEGYACHLAANVDEALNILGNQSIDIVISDIMMPGRSGVDLLKDLKKIDSDIAVLMITGLTDMTTAMECIHLGADDYISKPFSISRVVLTVKNMLEKRYLTLERREYQAGLEAKVMEQTIELQVRSAVRSVETNTENVKIATLASGLSQKQYELEKARFDAGLSTTYRVLQSKNDLDTARVNELQAKVSLHTAIAALHRLEGSSLQRYSITLQ